MPIARIPKLALHNANSWSDCRSGFFSDLEHWDVEACFSICTTTVEYMPEIADRMFVWPNFVDPAVYRDYGLEKPVPVMLCGKAHGLYPWRRAVFPVVSELFPTLNCPQFAHQSGLSHRSLTGTAYARALNASQISLTCGTMAREVVRKHFEIPGCATCMVTERAEVLEAAGFVHMENCVFAEPAEVVDVIDHLLSQPDAVSRIARGGHELVHARHTLRHRPQIHQWLMLQASLAPGETIVQPGPFSDLVVQSAGSPAVAGWVSREGVDRALLREAARCLGRGRNAEARELYGRCLDHVSYLPEARLGLAVVELHDGAPVEAGAILAKLVEGTTVGYGAADPDPVEWGYFVLAVLCQGRLEEALDLCGWYPDLAHPELSRVRREILRLAGQVSPAEAGGAGRPTVHVVPMRDDAAWTAWLANLLDTCGQGALARRLEGGPSAEMATAPQRGRRARANHALGLILSGLGLERLRPNLPATADFNYLQHVRRGMARLISRTAIGGRVRDMRRRQRAAGEMAEIRNRLRSLGS